MHQTGVVTDDRGRQRQHVHRFCEAGAARQIKAIAAAGLRNLRSDRLVIGGAVQGHLPAALKVAAGEVGIMPGRPALGAAELGPGAEREDRALRRQPELAPAGLGLQPVDHQARRRDLWRQGRARDDLLTPGGRRREHAVVRHHVEPRRRDLCRQGGTPVLPQSDELLHHQRVGPGIQHPQVVEQAVTHLAAPAGATRDAGKQRHQRRLEGVGQQDGLIVSCGPQGLSQPPAPAERELAVLDRQRDRAAHFRHPRQDRLAPGRRQDVDFHPRTGLLQIAIQRLRHHHVPHPGGTHDQDFQGL